MNDRVDILIVGTGAFAARILFDLAATAPVPTRIAVAGRNVQRLGWLRAAARARAHMYGRPVAITTVEAAASEPPALAEMLLKARPAVVVQAASLQSGSVIAAQGNAWSKLVATGGLSASAVFQAILSSRVARACAQAAPDAHVVNTCFPDVANSIIKAMGLPVTCGIGNIQILAHAFGGHLPASGSADMKVLAHYQNLAAWRRQPGERAGANARVWLDGAELADVYRAFADIQLTPEPVIDISGAAAAPLLQALAHGHPWRGHAPGPDGLPGGYPVAVDGGKMKLDLPADLTRDAAVAWNSAHEQASGLIVNGDGFARYTGRLHDELAAVSPALAAGFHVRDLESVFLDMLQLRDRLLARAGSRPRGLMSSPWTYVKKTSNIAAVRGRRGRPLRQS